MPGGDAAPGVEARSASRRTRSAGPVADILATPEPGVVVEIVGGQAVVSHQLVGTATTSRSSRAPAPPGPDWYFAAGTTVEGAEHVPRAVQPVRRRRHRRRHVPHRHRRCRSPTGCRRVVVPRRSRVTSPVQDVVPAPGARRHPRARPRRPGRRRAHADLRRHGPRHRADPQGHRGVARRPVAGDGLADRRGHHGERRHRIAGGRQLRRNRCARRGPRRARRRPDARSAVRHRAVGWSDRASTVTTRAPLETDYAVTATAAPSTVGRVPVVAEMLASWAADSSTPGVASTLGSTVARPALGDPQPDVDAGGFRHRAQHPAPSRSPPRSCRRAFVDRPSVPRANRSVAVPPGRAEVFRS